MKASDDHINPEAAVAPGYLANHGARVFNRLVDAALRPHGLSMALINPLLLLWWKGPMLQRDLVHSSAVKQPAMVALLDKLETMSLITRTPSDADRRASSVKLTELGLKAALRGRKALLDANNQGLAGFLPEEADLLVRLLQRMIVNFEQAPEHLHQV